jgi:hypothetical protein
MAITSDAMWAMRAAASFPSTTARWPLCGCGVRDASATVLAVVMRSTV